MNSNIKKQQKQGSAKTANALEALKDIGQHTAQQMHEEIANFPQDFFNELVSGPSARKSYSGELNPGDSLEMNEVFSGKKEENDQARNQIAFERRLLEEEKVESSKKTNEVKMELKMIQDELIKIAQSTDNLAKETEIASMQVAVDPGIYHIIFFQKLLEFVRSYRKKINEANVWLASANNRAGKKAKGWVGNYQKHGAKYLLSGEHYAQRSAG